MEKIRNLKFFVLLMLVFVSITLHAYQNGDYMAKVSGYWKSNKMWKIYYRGRWHDTVSHPDENCNGTIYIPAGKHLYITKYPGHYGAGETITIKNKLVVNGVLTAIFDPDLYAQILGTINLEGDLEVNGRIGTCYCHYVYDPDDEFDPSINLNCYGNSSLNSISGNGRMYINKIFLYGNYEINILSRIMQIEYRNPSIVCTLNSSSMYIKNLYVNKSNSILSILDNVLVRECVYVDGGNSFSSAPILSIESGGMLSLSNYSKNTKISLGENGHYAKLIVEGDINNRATISADEGYPWELSYAPPAHPWLSGGEKVMISAENADFVGMSPNGFVIKGGVKIKNNKFSFCRFANSYGEGTESNNPTSLLKFEGKSRSLDLFGCSFINYNGNYNIYKSSHLGFIHAWYCDGNLNGEAYDYDPYNTVRWNRSRNNSTDNQGKELINAEVNLSNYPNPFNPSTTINYQLPKSGKISLSIYNLKGEKIKDLINNKLQDEGIHNITWNGKDNSNKDVSSGTYIYKLRLNNKIYNGRMSLLK